jgi:hypothetical protein
MTNQLKIEVGDTVRIAKTSVHYNKAEESNPKCDGVVVEYCGTLDVDWDNGFSNTYQSYDLTLIKKGKTMQFTKSDLKAGVHFVKNREGTFAAVCRNVFCGEVGVVRLTDFNDELLNIKGNPEMDIVEVYETDKDRSMTSYLKGLGLKRIWERTEQTEAQKEMEVLQAQIDKGAAYMAELHEQAKRLRDKL